MSMSECEVEYSLVCSSDLLNCWRLGRRRDGHALFGGISVSSIEAAIICVDIVVQRS